VNAQPLGLKEWRETFAQVARKKIMSSKILKPAGSVPDELELQVARNMLDLENSVPELKADLRILQISAAKQV
jgi:hypothetical protein